MCNSVATALRKSLVVVTQHSGVVGKSKNIVKNRMYVIF